METGKCSVAIIILFVIFAIVGCGDKNSENTEQNTEVTFKYDTKMAMLETEDGWVHHFVCEFSKTDGKPLMYYYDAYNLKYRQLEGYTLEVTDADGNVCDIMYPSAPYMLLRDEYYNDFMSLDAFFNNGTVLDTLSEKEAEALELEYLDKDMIVKLFNTAIESENMPDGKYYYMPESGILQDEAADGYLWQVGYFVVHGMLVSIDIEMIYDDGTYLTDIVADGKGDAGQLALEEMISLAEEEILSEQTMDISGNTYEGVDESNYKRLCALLKKAEEGGYD